MLFFSVFAHPTVILPSSSELSYEWQLLSQIPKLFRMLSQFFGIVCPRVSGQSLSQFVTFPHPHTLICSCSKLVALWAEALEGLRAICRLWHWKSVLLHPPPAPSAKCCVQVNVCCWAGKQMNCTRGSLLWFWLFRGFTGCPASVY